MKKITVAELQNTLKRTFPNFKFLGKGKVNKSGYIYLKDQDGIVYRSRISNLLKKIKPTIQTAVDKNFAFTIAANKIHGKKYDYSLVDYKNAKTKVIIICKKHGEFKQTPNCHLMGKGCKKCSIIKSASIRTKKLEDFINEANLKHDYKYFYDKTLYIKQNIQSIITCKIHGDFLQTPKDHLSGRGCTKCGNLNKGKNSQGYSRSNWIKIANNYGLLYIIRVWNNKEQFIKIGITSRTVRIRFNRKSYLPYNYEVIKTKEGSPGFVWDLERTLHHKFNDFRYLPLKKFNGMYECFKMDIKDKIII